MREINTLDRQSWAVWDARLGIVADITRLSATIMNAKQRHKPWFKSYGRRCRMIDRIGWRGRIQLWPDRGPSQRRKPKRK